MATPSGSGGNMQLGIFVDFDKNKAKSTKQDIQSYIDGLQRLINKDQLEVTVSVNPNSKTFLEATEKSVKRIKEEMKALEKEREKLQEKGMWRDKSTNRLTAEAEALIQKYRELQVAREKSVQTLAETNKRVNKYLQDQEKQLQRLNNEYKRQGGYLDRLVKRMAVYASFGAAFGFITKIREVTAEFELQRVSLGAIIQDQNRANQLFSEIKSFALKSPVKILDLTKYVKQVAAYRIETDKLFETTKRLADVSVGLGVDMQRIVLAYGQVKAASYLRAAEVRQFTEAGIPMLELLAEKFTKLNGQMVSTEEVMEKISKRGVGFEMVEEIFKDMTDAGGMFYNMQEKQGDTLFGMWAKLGDAASIMYDKIGNTDSVNNAMKGTINLLTDLMRNWKAAAVGMAALGAGFGLGMFAKSAYKAGEKKIYVAREAADTKAAAATANRKQKQEELNQALRRGSIAEQQKARDALKTAQSEEQAALKEQKRFYGLKAGFAQIKAGLAQVTTSMLTGLGIGVAITAITAVIYEIAKAITKASELENELEKIRNQTTNLQTQSVENFKRLVNEFSHAESGSQKQKEILDEIQRSYKQMIPEELLTIENLEKITAKTEEAAKGYEALTSAIKTYIAAQQRQKQLDTIAEVTGQTVNDMQRRISDALKADSFMDTDMIQRFFDAFEKYAEKTNMSLKEKFTAAMKEAGVESGERIAKAWDKTIGVYSDWMTRIKYLPTPFTDNDAQRESASALKALAEAYQTAGKYIEDVNKKMESNLALTVEQQKEIENFKNAMHNLDSQDETIRGTPVGENMSKSLDINKMVENMKAEFSKLKVVWNDEWARLINSTKPEEFVSKMSSIDFDRIIRAFELNISKLSPKQTKLLDYVKQYQKLYAEMVPKDAYVQQIRFKLQQISYSMSDHGKQMKQYLIGITESSDAYYKRLKEGLEHYEALAKQLQASIKNSLLSKAMYGIANALGLKTDLDTVNEMIKGIKELMSFVKPYTPPEKKTKEKAIKAPKEPKPKTGSTKEDTTKQDLMEVVKVLEDIQKKYAELEKAEGPAKAAEHTKEAMSATLAKANALYKKYGGKKSFDYPLTIEALIEDIDKIIPLIANRTKTVVKESSAYVAHINKEIAAHNRGDIKTENKLKMSRPSKYSVEKVNVNTDKDVLDLMRKQSDLQLDNLRKYIQNRLKELATEISQTKEAKDFYEKILSATGDTQMAMNVTMAIYGETGDALKNLLQEQIGNMFEGAGVEMPVGIVMESGSIDYKALEKQAELLKDTLGKDTYEALIKIAKEGQKDWAKSFEGYLKDIEKAKSYSQQRIELARTTAKKINEIRSGEHGVYDEKTQDYLIQGELDKAQKEAAKQEWEAFKDTPMYVQMFDDLEFASTEALESMMKMLEHLKKVWGESLDPQNMKEMQSRMNEIRDEWASRNPIKGIITGIKELKSLNKTYGSQSEATRKLTEDTKELLDAKEKLDLALKYENTEYAGMSPALAQVEYDKIFSEYEPIKRLFDEKAQQLEDMLKSDMNFYNTKEGLAFQEEVNKLAEQITAYEKKLALLKEIISLDGKSVQKYQDQVDSLEQQVKNGSNIVNRFKKAKELINASVKSLSKWQQKFEEVAGLLGEIKGLLGIVDDSVAGVVFDSAVSGLERMAAIYGVLITLQEVFNKETWENPWMAVASAVLAVTSALADWIGNEKVREANKIIERYDKIISRLEYSYSRLQAAQEKLFGTEYIENYNQQLSNLAATAEAYRKQAEAEKSKGKKADEDAIKDYEDSWRDTMDEIADMQTALRDHLAGTDMTSAARDWAKSWMDARWAFEDTTEAMKEKFADMVQNMIIESMAAQLAQNVLAPIYDMIDAAAKKGQITSQDITNIAKKGYEAIGTMNNAMETLLTELQNAGLNLSEMFEESSSEATGIARNVSNATSEEINANTAALNTQNYYMSHVPTISENVMAIRLLMEGGSGVSVGSGVDLMTLQNEHLSQLPIIAANTLATAERCERAAVACEAIQSAVERVVDFTGNRAVVNATLY